jgi:gamma-glutamylcyclotransferase (GGCT)/AIG2-like uncharacterized protein YtfP
MKWWQSNPLSGHILEAIIHINRASDSIDFATKTDICKLYFNALNKLQIEYNQVRGTIHQGEVKSFRELITNGFPEIWQRYILKSEELTNLINLKPMILNHDILKRNKYRPGETIDKSLAKKASVEHRRLNNAYEDYLSTMSSDNQGRVMKRMAELLYVVRSNIAHGEKTPYGPDIEKVKRDEMVCSIIIPIQLTLLMLILDRPDFKLVVYGTLAPGEPNHYFLEDIKGVWKDCQISGKIKMYYDFPFFKWNPSSPKIQVNLFKSESLLKIWQELDQFEGSHYIRHIVPAFVEDNWEIAYVYEKSF